MRLRTALRTAAIVIALAAFIDPAFTREVAQLEPVTVVAMDEASFTTAVRISESMESAGRSAVWRYDERSAAAACPANGACVIVASTDAPVHVSAGARVIGVVHATDVADRVIESIRAASPQHPDAAARMQVQTTKPVGRIEIFDGDTLVGFAEAEDETSVTVPWVPIAEGARALRVVAGGDSANVGVVVSSAPTPILFYEPQATWLGTFVRRTLEDDPRFSLQGRTRLAPSISVARGGAGALNRDALEAVDAAIVTAPDLLTAADVDLLDAYVEQRGGSLVVVTDRRPTGAVARLLPRVVSERRNAEPKPIGPLHATEWLTFDPVGVGLAALGSIDEEPVVISQARGRGRVIVFGALDAWRFRQQGNAFAEYWSALIWDASVVAGPRLRVTSDRVVAQPGEAVNVGVELQELHPLTASDVEAAGHVQCGNHRTLLRLWPNARPGSFNATFRSDVTARCEVVVTAGELTATTPVTFQSDIRTTATDEARLTAIAAAHGAPFITADSEAELVNGVRQQVTLRQAVTHPMRSAYWLLPFVACLSADWWLRRRSGLS